MPLIPPAEFAPDQPALSEFTDIVLNVVPLTKESYGPLRSLEPFSDALDSQCRGVVSVQDSDLATFTFAGTETTLNMITGGDITWNDVSQAGAYSTGDQEYWRFGQFHDLVIATNFIDPVQAYDMSSPTLFADLAAGAPKGRHIAIVRNFCVVANTNDPSDSNVPMRVWWSAYNNATDWPVPGSADAQAKQSDFTDLVGDQGAITGLVGHLGGADGAVFFARGVWRMVYQGPPTVFGFYPAEGVSGTRASNSIVHIGPTVYYLAEDGFAVFDGTRSQPIGGQKVDRWFFDRVDHNYLDQVIGAVDPINKLVFWIFPSTAATVPGAPDTMLIFNFQIGRWSYAETSAEWLLRSLSFGVSLDGLDALFPGGIDSIPYSLDSRLFVGGAVQLSAIDTDHKLAFFAGQTLEAQIATRTAQPFDGMRAWVRSVRPLVDGGVPTVAMGLRDRLVDTVAFGSDVAMNSMGESPQRADGRYISALVKVPAGSNWEHMRGIDLDAEKGGWR
jgi:hypothetical protein